MVNYFCIYIVDNQYIKELMKIFFIFFQKK